MLFIVIAEPLSALSLWYAVRELGGRLLCSCWIVPWRGTADSLALKLRNAIRAMVVVCRLEDDWSYR
jgi:hypothetical protein